MRPNLGRWFASVGALVVIAFVLQILMPALSYIDEQQYTELTSLGISDGYRVAAILFGMSLAAIIAVLRLIETTDLARFRPGGAGGRRRQRSCCGWFQPQLTSMVFGSLFVFFVVMVARLRGDRRADRFRLRHRHACPIWR